ncbi:MAG: reductive dehalogenase domain-containing protein [Deltaproteobacteria bacterium]
MPETSKERKRVIIILGGSLAFIALWGLMLIPWGNKESGAYLTQGEVYQAGSPDQVFNALMVPEYTGPTDKTFVYKGICNEDIRVPLEAPVNQVKRVINDRRSQSEEIKTLARSLGADIVGICELNPKWKFSGVPLNHKYAIAVGEALPYSFCREQKDDVKAMISTKSALDFYRQGGKIALFLADTIREMGYPARAHYESWSQVLTVPVTVDAGLGEVGRNSLLITPEYGPRCRFAIVTTDLPLETDKKTKSSGITEFCEICDRCVTTCPAKAIPAGGPTVTRGVVKWQLDLDKCFKYWYQGSNAWSRCMVCMTACPWNKADNVLHKVGSFLASRSPFSRWVILKVDGILGYGEKVDTTPIIRTSSK